MKRIFVAVDISEAAKELVGKHQEELKKGFPTVRVGWEKREKLHLTLKFLGEIDDERLAELEVIVKKTAQKFSKFKLFLRNNGVFPNKKRAKILWFGIDDKKGSLTEIKENLEAELEKLGFAKEKRRFKPHLTIARLREPSKDLVSKHLENKIEPVGFEVSGIVIYESELRPTGSVYKIVSKHELI